MESLSDISDYFKNKDKDSMFYAVIANSFTPMVLFMFNYVFIPTFIDNISYYEDYETKSERHRNNLYK